MWGTQVSICPGGVPTGYTYFIPQEEHLESRVVTRAYLEARGGVAVSGRGVPPQRCRLTCFAPLEEAPYHGMPWQFSQG